MRRLLVPFLLLTTATTRAQSPTAKSPEDPAAQTVRAFYRAVAQGRFHDAVDLFEPASMARVHDVSTRWFLAWAYAIDTLPATHPAKRPGATWLPNGPLARIDSAMLARFDAKPLPRFAPGATVGMFARMAPRDAMERLITLKWARYVRAMPQVRSVAYEGDSVAHVLAWWPGEPAPEDPLRALVFHLRRDRGMWRLDAGPPLFSAYEMGQYGIPRTDMPPLPLPGALVGAPVSTDGALVRTTVGRIRPTDPELMSHDDSLQWAASERALERTDTIVVRTTAVALRVGDTLRLDALGALPRDRAGRTVDGFSPAWRVEPAGVARLEMGVLVARAPGEAKLTVGGIHVSMQPGVAPARAVRPVTTITLTVTPRPGVPPGAVALTPVTPPGGAPPRRAARGGSSGGSSSDWRFHRSYWMSPSNLVPGDTLSIHSTAVHTGTGPLVVFARTCGGIELSARRGVTLRGPGIDACTIERRTLLPGDSIVGDARVIVDGPPGDHRVRWSLASPDSGESGSLSFSLAAATPGDTVRQGPGLLQFSPPRRVPYVLRIALSTRARGATVEEVRTAVNEAIQPATRIDAYVVSEEAFARTHDLPHLVVTLSVPDTGKVTQGVTVERRSVGANGVVETQRVCGSTWDQPAGTEPVSATPLVVRLALYLQRLVSGGCSGFLDTTRR